MPIHPHLDDVALDVAYQGSLTAQTVDLRVVYGGVAELPLAAWAVGTLVQCINRGFAGGAELPPSAGRAKLLAGPTGVGDKTAEECGPDLRFQLEVTAVSPRFLRTMLEYFAAAGRPHRLVSVSIVGSLAPGRASGSASPTPAGPELGVREGTLRAWLDDADAYGGAWKAGAPRVTHVSAPRGATVRVKLADAATPEIARELETTISAWQSAILTFPNIAKKTRGLMAPQCTFARTRSDVIARASLFDYARAPARASLENGLTWFHENIAKIDSAHVALA